ncbi:metallo-beta-lactamase domain-containing protein 1 [Diachasmimorpha longicaudata]|uniref:metallo-beta-lactamase domain-containing protein 1 n=1 Tax=Diachasmimorpha longicaudata TaxID=58733 RepID=UPI0030B8BF4F
MPQVIVLAEGFSHTIEGGNTEANCSCVLIKGRDNIIVDTMTAWDKDIIIEGLANHGVSPNDIAFVVCTHSHADHIGNNNLFLRADHIVGTCVHNRTVFTNEFRDAHYQLCPGVKLLRTPGHTHDDVSVIVESTVDGEKVTIAIVGDLFEMEDDLAKPEIWQAVGVKELRKTQAENRFLVVTLADYIIPGHGKMFKVTDEVRRLLKSQIPVD